MKHERIRVGITHGDINSISYEVIINTLLDSRMFDNYTIVLYGSAKVAAYHRKVLNINSFNFNQIKHPDEALVKRPNLISINDENLRVELGKSTQMAGEAALEALDLAVAHLKEGAIDVLITGPINKENIQSDKFRFNGHTEYLQEQFGARDSLMFMVSDFIRIGVVTGHVALNQVSSLLNEDTILRKLKLMNQSLIQDFNIRKPRIAVLGLNPHSGDNGLIGNEEVEVIIPTLEKARNMGILALGPYAADGFFGSNSYTKFDAVLAMYHDQGLIPFKTLAGEEGVNYTAGLTIVRTSPAHGTAFDLAGKSEASSDSFRKALFMACDIFTNRKEYDELRSNQLKNMDLSEFKNAVDQYVPPTNAADTLNNI